MAGIVDLSPGQNGRESSWLVKSGTASAFKFFARSPCEIRPQNAGGPMRAGRAAIWCRYKKETLRAEMLEISVRKCARNDGKFPVFQTGNCRFRAFKHRQAKAWVQVEENNLQQSARRIAYLAAVHKNTQVRASPRRRDKYQELELGGRQHCLSVSFLKGGAVKID